MHYMVDTSNKLKETMKFIEKGKYFIINRPRQYGKTTTFFLLNNKLEKSEDYLPISISFEGLGDYIFGFDQQSLEEVVGNMLRNTNLTLAVAESCTGGMLGETITSVPGSSDYFKGGIISYDGEVKENLLGVPHDAMIQYGQVSEQVASYMAQGVRVKCHSHLGIGITGIAGPDGGSTEKPVGLVYISLADNKQTIVEKHFLRKDRQTIRLRATRRALNMLRLYLLNYKDGRL